VQKGFLWAHMGWSLFLDTNWIDGIYSRVIPDWLSNKKLVW
jgi:fatty-acid desaturase